MSLVCMARIGRTMMPMGGDDGSHDADANDVGC